MIYDKIQGNYVDHGFQLPTSSIFVYYGEKTQGSKKLPSINYIANVDGTRIAGEFGKEWQTVYVNDSYGTNNSFIPQMDTIYIVNNSTSGTNKTINLPNVATVGNGAQFAVKFVGPLSCSIKIQSSTANIKNSHSNTTNVSNIVLNHNTPQCYIYCLDSSWIVTYQGVNVYNNITPYWNTKLTSPAGATTISGAAIEQNTRFLFVTHNTAATTIEFRLPALNNVQDNFRIALGTQYLDDYTNINIIAGVNNYVKLTNGNNVSQYSVDKTQKYIQLIKVDANYWHLFTNNEEYWITKRINSNTTAKSRYKYVCQSDTGLTLTLPSFPQTRDRVSVFVQKLLAPNVVKIQSLDTDIIVGLNTGYSTTIHKYDPQNPNNSANCLELEANLVYIEFEYFDSAWHVVKLDTPSSQRKYTAGYGLSESSTGEITLTGTIVIPDNNTITADIINEDGVQKYKFKVNNVGAKIDTSPSVYLSSDTNSTTHVTTITCNIPQPPSQGTYVLKSTNGSLSWIEVQTCDE